MNHDPIIASNSDAALGEVGREVSSVEALSALQERTLATARQVLAGIRCCALVDYPDHANVGDSMIWLGEVALLERLGIEIRYACSRQNYDRAMLERRIGADGAVLIHGGGNFGTLWPDHQEFRERLLAEFPQHRVVQMPQSINFERNDAALTLARTKIARHGAFSLLVRDVASREFARANFECPTALCPDMAFMIGALHSDQPASVDYMLLARSDKEQAAAWSSVFDKLPHERSACRDWLGFGVEEWGIARAQRAGRAAARRSLRANWLWEKLMREEARARMRRGVRLLGQGRIVVTDRLHAHVLCSLLDKPHVVLGDAHGKVRALYDTWSSRFACAAWCNNSQEALARARELLACAQPPLTERTASTRSN